MGRGNIMNWIDRFFYKKTKTSKIEHAAARKPNNKFLKEILEWEVGDMVIFTAPPPVGETYKWIANLVLWDDESIIITNRRKESEAYSRAKAGLSPLPELDKEEEIYFDQMLTNITLKARRKKNRLKTRKKDMKKYMEFVKAYQDQKETTKEIENIKLFPMRGL